MSGILDSDNFNAAFPVLDGNPTMQGFTVACYDIGCLIGALLVMGLADRLGRKWSMATGAASVIVGVVIQVVIFPKQVPHAGGLSQFIIGRIITGVGNGMNMASIPVYQAECLKPDKRGTMIAIEGGLIASGTSKSCTTWVESLPACLLAVS
jgi:MFS family permease